jgi:hypothetical protein
MRAKGDDMRGGGCLRLERDGTGKGINANCAVRWNLNGFWEVPGLVGVMSGSACLRIRGGPVYSDTASGRKGRDCWCFSRRGPGVAGRNRPAEEGGAGPVRAGDKEEASPITAPHLEKVVYFF